MIDAPSFTPAAASSFPGSFDPTLVVALTGLMAVTLVVFALLRGWQDWLELKRRELDTVTAPDRGGEESAQLSVGAARIELADMKERIKKLEAIASGVEL
ncbi:MAG: hypothetical protein AAF559_05925 [Pseudomonadota bacterium]